MQTKKSFFSSLLMPDLDITILIRSEILSQNPWPTQLKPRPRIQRAFDRLYRANECRFLIKLIFIRRIDSCLTFGFEGVNKIIDASLSFDLSVHVTWDNTACNILLSLDVYPKRAPGGYVCAECDPATRQTFPTREALWEYELFEPFLLWVNQRLAPAHGLSLQQRGGMTMATLMKDTPPGLIPLQWGHQLNI